MAIEKGRNSDTSKNNSYHSELNNPLDVLSSKERHTIWRPFETREISLHNNDHSKNQESIVKELPEQTKDKFNPAENTRSKMNFNDNQQCEVFIRKLHRKIDHYHKRINNSKQWIKRYNRSIKSYEQLIEQHREAWEKCHQVIKIHHDYLGDNETSVEGNNQLLLEHFKSVAQQLEATPAPLSDYSSKSHNEAIESYKQIAEMQENILNIHKKAYEAHQETITRTKQDIEEHKKIIEGSNQVIDKHKQAIKGCEQSIEIDNHAIEREHRREKAIQQLQAIKTDPEAKKIFNKDLWSNTDNMQNSKIWQLSKKYKLLTEYLKKDTKDLNNAKKEAQELIESKKNETLAAMTVFEEKCVFSLLSGESRVNAYIRNSIHDNISAAKTELKEISRAFQQCYRDTEALLKAIKRHPDFIVLEDSNQKRLNDFEARLTDYLKNKHIDNLNKNIEDLRFEYARTDTYSLKNITDDTKKLLNNTNLTLSHSKKS